MQKLWKKVQNKINYRELLDVSAEAIMVVRLNGDIVDANRMACELLQRNAAEVIGRNIADLIYLGKAINLPLFIEQKVAVPGTSFIFKNKLDSGGRIPIEVAIKPFSIDTVNHAVIIAKDIRSRKHAEEVIQQKNEYLSLLHETTLAIMNHLELEDLLTTITKRAEQLVGTENILIVLYNEETKRMEQKLAVGFYSKFDWNYAQLNKSAIGKAFVTKTSIVVNDYPSWPNRADWNDDFQNVKAVAAVPLKLGTKVVGAIAIAHTEAGRNFNENELMTLTRFAELASIALDNARLYTTAQKEIIERIRAEESLRYCSYHDVVTGIYNRAYFENKMQLLEGERRVPVGIIICDVDGLKFVNDSFGHLRGDALLETAADIIKRSFREEDIVARIGGDEFAILLPDSTASVVELACSRIRDSVDRFNESNPELPISISVGFAVAEDCRITAGELFKKADNNMYQDKIRRSRSSRSAMKQALVQALETRDFINTGHAERMEKMVIGMAALLKLPSRMLEDLRLLAQFHDIGKVGIVDSVLFKKGLLNAEEMAEMRRHSEIGHRIAQSVPELMPIGDYILKHHEWWNGQGYPLGLAGAEIPLESRVLAIVDAYDAMTSGRPYRPKVTSAQAMEEIGYQAGRQFDPELVRFFKKSMKGLGKTVC